MKNWFNRNFRAIIITAFVIPIITVALVSISHVTVWYGISNPISWAIYLSIGIEIAALSALAAISANMGSKVYFPFGIVTLIQFIGNIYFSYQYIDINVEEFKEWVELVSPLLEYIGIEGNDYIGHKRFLSLFAGGMLPIISLSFLHMLVKFTQENKNNETKSETKDSDTTQKINASDLVGEISRVRLSDEDLKTLEAILLNPPKPNQELKKTSDEYKNEKVNPKKYVEEDESLFEDYENFLGNEIIPTPIPSAYSTQPITPLEEKISPPPSPTMNQEKIEILEKEINEPKSEEIQLTNTEPETGEPTIENQIQEEQIQDTEEEKKKN